MKIIEKSDILSSNDDNNFKVREVEIIKQDLKALIGNYSDIEDSIILKSSLKTNLIYKITPEVEEDQIIGLNSLETYSARIRWLVENGYHLQFAKMNSEIFRTNLELIDSRLPEILSHLLLHRYLGGPTKLLELTNYLNESNPCNFNTNINPHFYTYKIKRLLVDAALGMKAGTLWTGTFSATGGYIAVKKDGELLCFHIYNWNDFQDYLLNFTKIDFPDSSPNRCDFGRVLTADEVGETEGSFIKLNFQIRFT